MTPLDPALYRDLVRRAIAEDLGAGDITTEAIVPDDVRASGVLLAKSRCVLAGLDVAREVFDQVDGATVLECVKADGDECESGQTCATVSGRAASLLAAERTALNFLQHMSGIATLTRRFVDAAGGRVMILDTRKSVPTLRALAKYAVRCGGGVNHRVGLHDGVLIKDNHIRVAGGIVEAVRRARARRPGVPIEVETQSLTDVDDALQANADVIMLDNLTDTLLRHAVSRIGGRARVEISGGVTLDRLPVLAAMGADCVSVGALTHSAAAADLSLEIHTE
jgi:nicotinate-nucleotide pyrophosphorylase (carboxylating)